MNIQAINVADTIGKYTHNARYRSTDCTALARQLERAAPGDLTSDQRAALAEAVRRATEVDRVVGLRARGTGPAVRTPRIAVSVGWSGLDRSLEAVSSLPGAEGVEATTLRARIFPEGTGFTKLDAVAMWGTSKVIFDRIAAEALAPRIDALVHPRLLAQVRTSFDALGEAIGVSGAAAPPPAKPALLEATARFSFAVAAYARALTVGLSDTDEDALARFLAAVAPIDALRVIGKPGDEDDDEPEDDDLDAPIVDAPTPDDGPTPLPDPFVE